MLVWTPSSTIQAPMNAATSLFLTVQCGACFILLWRRRRGRRPSWALFFLLMGVANAAAVPKHGLHPSLSGLSLALVLAVSNVATGVAVRLAQRATLEARSGLSRLRGRLATGQLLAYLGAHLLVGPEMLLLIANTVVGLTPVIASEAARGRREPGGRLVAGGLALSLLTGATYLGRISPGPWFDHIDVAHLLMGVSFHLIYVGVAAERFAPEAAAPPGRWVAAR